MAGDRIRDGLQSRPTLLNAWMTIGAALTAEIAGRAGFDLVTVDQQHGIGGYPELLASLMAARAAGLPALVRVATNDTGLIGRALDLGAQGVICPMINTASDARRLVEAVKYPPVGARSAGPVRASLVVEGDYIAGANAWTIACAQIETAEAMDNLDAILGTPGIDMVYVGPNDLTISLSNGKSRDINGETTTKAIDRILAGCRKHGVIAGIYCNDEAFAKPLIAKGWQVVTVGSDGRWVSSCASAVVALLQPVASADKPMSAY
jgi:4-hydroxy-2-oxoheptanedioate aldolase